MIYCLHKLAFDAAVHFGGTASSLSLYRSEDHFCADTLFSALCHTALSLGGQEELAALCREAGEGNLLLSDGMPWLDETFFLPRPTVSAQSETELPAARRKALKKLRWIPVEDFAAFSASVRGGPAYDPDAAQPDFGLRASVAKVQVIPGADARPYQVGLYRFRDNAGLWFLAGCATQALAEELQRLVEGLSLSGIGGETSAGYGAFHLADTVIFLNEPFDPVTEWLYAALCDEKAERQLLLSTSLPSDEELTALLPESEYMLTRRAGFVRSADFAPEARRKATQLFLSAGSVLPGRFRPKLYQVGEAGTHPVYRLSAPLFLGVTL